MIGLSYCRHMRKVRASVAHMIDTSRLILDNDPAHQHPVLSEELWREFTEIRNVSQSKSWNEDWECDMIQLLIPFHSTIGGEMD